MAQYWKRITAAVVVVVGLFFGLIHAHNPFTPTPGPSVTCISVDPQDESPRNDYDAHNCPGVR